MESGILIDGIDVEDEYGLIVRNVTGHLNGVVRVPVTQEVPGRDDALYLDPGGTIQPRKITLIGTQRGSTRADFIAKRRALMRALSLGPIALVLPDQPDLEFRGSIDALPVTPISPDLDQLAADITISITCPDPYAYDLLTSSVSLSAAPAPVPMGDGRTLPRIMIEGPATDPILILKDYSGDEVARMDFTGTVLAGDESLVIDTYSQTVVDQDGVNAIHLYVASTSTWPRLLPAYADLAAEDWPTIELTDGSGELVYRRAWL